MKALAAFDWRALLERLPVDTSGLERLRDEWQGNPRLRRGLLAIWALFLLYLVLVLSDHAAERRSDLVQVKTRLDRLEAIHEQQYWLERAERSRVALADLEASFPVVASSGRAEAQVRSALQEHINASGDRRKLRLGMKTAEPLDGGKLWQVSGTVRGVLKGNDVREFLANMEPTVTHGRIQRLTLVRGLTAKKVRLEAEIEYFFRAEDG